MGNREGGRKGGRRVFVWLNASEESVKGRKCNVGLFEIAASFPLMKMGSYYLEFIFFTTEFLFLPFVISCGHY